MENLKRDEEAFVKKTESILLENGTELMKEFDGNILNKIIIIGKSNKSDNYFSSCASILKHGVTEKTQEEHLIHLFGIITKEFNLRTSKITEIIFEVIQDKKLLAIRTDGAIFNIEKSTGKYTF